MRLLGRGLRALFGLVYRNHNLLIVLAAFTGMAALAT